MHPWKRLLFWRYRPDGVCVRDSDPVLSMMPYLMTTRTEASIYYSLQLDITRTKEFLRSQPDITLFTLFLTAMVRTAGVFPKLNRFVAGKRVYQRNSIQLSFVIKRNLTLSGSESVVKVTFSPEDTLIQVAEQVKSIIDQVRATQRETNNLVSAILAVPGPPRSAIMAFGRFLNRTGLIPAGLVESDPLFTSAVVANLGSIGAGAPFHHLYEWGTASIFVTMGKYKQVPVMGLDGSLETKTLMDVAFTFDERIADGYYFARALESFQDLVQNPAQLLKAPQEVKEDE